MSAATTIGDPKTLFERWFDNAIAKLRELPNADGGTAGMMIVLPLYDRYIYIVQGSDKSRKRSYEAMKADLGLASPSEARTFWRTLRHGFCHTGMPLERSDQGDVLPKVILSGTYSWRPEFLTASNGQEIICLNPWQFIDHVMDKYRRDSTLLTKYPDAPLLAIHVVTLLESSGDTHGYSGFGGAGGAMTSSQHVYEIRPRKDRRGVDLISALLPFGALWYDEPDAVGNAINYAMFYRRSHRSVIRVYDEAGNVIETHEHKGDFKEW